MKQLDLSFQFSKRGGEREEKHVQNIVEEKKFVRIKIYVARNFWFLGNERMEGSKCVGMFEKNHEKSFNQKFSHENLFSKNVTFFLFLKKGRGGEEDKYAEDSA